MRLNVYVPQFLMKAFQQACPNACFGWKCVFHLCFKCWTKQKFEWAFCAAHKYCRVPIYIRTAYDSFLGNNKLTPHKMWNGETKLLYIPLKMWGVLMHCCDRSTNPQLHNVLVSFFISCPFSFLAIFFTVHSFQPPCLLLFSHPASFPPFPIFIPSSFSPTLPLLWAIRIHYRLSWFMAQSHIVGKHGGMSINPQLHTTVLTRTHGHT